MSSESQAVLDRHAQESQTAKDDRKRAPEQVKADQGRSWDEVCNPFSQTNETSERGRMIFESFSLPMFEACVSFEFAGMTLLTQAGIRAIHSSVRGRRLLAVLYVMWWSRYRRQCRRLTAALH